MATVKVCDKCNNIGTHSKFTFYYDQQHERGKEEWTTRERTTYDLCDKCAMELAKIIDPFADAVMLDDYPDEP